MKLLATAFAMLFALVVNCAPAMADSDEQDSGHYKKNAQHADQQDQNEDDDRKDESRDEDERDDKDHDRNKSDDD